MPHIALDFIKFYRVYIFYKGVKMLWTTSEVLLLAVLSSSVLGCFCLLLLFEPSEEEDCLCSSDLGWAIENDMN